MREVVPDDAWPESWRRSYEFDRHEVYLERPRTGYERSYRVRTDHAIRLVRIASDPPATVLDVAAAQGNLTLRLAELGYAVTWNDLRADLVDYVRAKHTSGVVEFAPGNILDDEFRDRQFDVVLATEVIEHVAHPDRFLERLASMTRPGGHVVVTTPLGSYIRNSLPRFSEVEDPSVYEPMQFRPDADGHLFLLHLDEVHRFAEQAGLEVLRTDLYGNPMTTGHMKLEALTRCLPVRATERLERITSSLPMPLRRRVNAGVAALFRRIVR